MAQPATQLGIKHVVERFEVDPQGRVWRDVQSGGWRGPRMSMKATATGESQDHLRAAWDRAWLQGQLPTVGISRSPPKPQLRVVDLFAGCGGMSLGVRTAAEALGLEFQSVLAADMEPAALRTYRWNLHPAEVFGEDLSTAVRFDLGSHGQLKGQPRLCVPSFASLVGGVDVLLGGPPCQGHSDLNNHSRRDDPKNSLYFLMAAIAVAMKPTVVIIENVPSVVHDRSRVVARSRQALADAGYAVDELVISMSSIGVAQRRKRHVLVALKGAKQVDLRSAISAFETQQRPVSWAIGDLLDRNSDTVFDTASQPNEENRRRIDWLFEKGAFDLPNSRRPDCHREDGHSYVSMYGRMHWDEPAQTVTSGFGSPGQGRYIHSRRRRTITPHEAARLQFFPDSFSFDPENSLLRSKMAVMIGNAVPPKLSYVVGLAAISELAAVKWPGVAG